MAAEIATAGAEKVAGSFREVFIIQQFKDCYNLEENSDFLGANVSLMESKLSYVRTQFQKKGIVLPDPVQKCITKMEEEVEKAKKLGVRIEERGSRCFDCWNLCYPELSTECRKWKTQFDDLFKELHDEFQCLSNIKRILPAVEAKSLLHQPVPDAGFVGSDIKSAGHWKS